MRQPDTIPPATPKILQTLIAAIPESQLRELVLSLLLDAPARGPPVAPARRRRPVRPAGKRRGQPPKVGAGKGAVARKAKQPAADLKLAARRARQAAARRAKRAAARAVPMNGANGSTKKATPAAQLWEHAERLSPGAPFKAIARELGVNSAVALDAFRDHKLPPGIGTEEVARFLEVPTS